jgi:hypothetical protein
MSYRETSRFQYKTFKYDPEEDCEPDVIKIFHYVIDERYGVDFWMPLSPYEFAKEETFRAWIDSGLPNREKINASMGRPNTSNPSQEDIVNYYIEYMLVKNET